MTYSADIADADQTIRRFNGNWDGISAESVARMRSQNRFRTGLDIARHTAKIMRADMAAYDADPAHYTQSLGCWHGFIAQQKMISIKKHFGTTKGRYLYLSGWMIAALRSDFGPLPDQSMHEKTSVPALIEEIYTFLKQADARELGMMFRDLDAAREAGDELKAKQVQATIDNYETHVVPIIADIDAGFGNAEATYLLAKKMIEAGACALQIENQVSDEKQCGHQDGKVTVPHEDFLAKVRACRYAFLELGVEDGIIVTRTDSLGAGLTKQIAVSKEPGDLGDQYNSFLDCEEVTAANARNGDVITVTASARSFLHHQVRSMVGSLKLVGEGRWQPRDMRAALAASGALIGVQKIDGATKDLAPIVAAVKAARPDGVVFVSPFSAMDQNTGMITQLTAAGLGGAKLWLTGQNTADYSQALPAGTLTNVTGILEGAQPTAVFAARIAAVAPAVTDLLYAEEAYDATILAALAATVAKDASGSAIAAELREVSARGIQCTTYRECLDALKTSSDINYDGISGATTFDANGDTSPAHFGLYRYDAAGRFTRVGDVTAG